MNINFKKVLSIFKQFLLDGKDWLSTFLRLGLSRKGERRKLNYIFRIRDRIFFKKKKPVSDAYPFAVVDPFEVFGEDQLYGDFNLVGDDWRDKNNDKPVAILWGFNNWKWGFVSDYLPEYRTAFAPRKILSLQSLLAIRRFSLKPAAFIFWGYTEPWIVRWYATKNNIKIYRMEDGFIRSSSLGASHSTPYSLLLDAKGLHYNPEKVSDIEEILNNHSFTEQELATAKTCMDLMQYLALSKYNPPSFNTGNQGIIKIRRRVVVLGQVDNDLSVRLGNPDRWSMVELIRLAKIENPDGDILYRPHPDIYQGFQKSKFRRRSAEKICELVSPDVPLIEFLDTVDHVYTITSLSGLEALLKGKKVTVVGAAFYAGWGLTDDRVIFPRRTTKRTLVEIFGCVYLKYPRYLADLNDSEIGFHAACLRIEADCQIATYDLARKYDLTLPINVQLVAKSNYWPLLFFGENSNDVLELAEKYIMLINFPKLLDNNQGLLFQVALMYAMCGSIKRDTARNEFITTVRRFIDVRVLNDLLITLSEFHSGSYVTIQLAWLLTENMDNDASLNILSFHLKKLKGDQEAKVELEFRDVSVSDNSGRKPSEKSNDTTIDPEQQRIMLNVLDNHIEHKRFDEAIKIAKILLITNYAVSSILLKLAKLSELTFDSSSARAIALLCQKIDLYGENRKAISIALHNLPTYEVCDERTALMRALSLELKLNPERINNSFVLNKRYLKSSLYNSVIRAMLSLDNSKTFQKSMAYLEVGQPEKSLGIIENIVSNGGSTGKLKIAYSKTLSAIGKYDAALSVMKEARKIEATELNFRESLRLLTYLGSFEEAFQLIKEAYRKKIFISEAILITIYLGMGNIEDGYKCYLNVPFRQEIINYFGKKYKQDQNLVSDNLLIMSVYGPGDEVRFSSLYDDFQKKFLAGSFRVTCDYRLAPLLRRSFPEIEFCEIKRTRNYSHQYPRELYDRLPGSDLCTVLDNYGLDIIKKSNEIVMATDLIWQFRKTYNSFPGKSYFKHDENLTKHYANRLPRNIKLIGLSWRSSLTTHSRNVHYLTVEELEPIFKIDGVKFVNFQYDECQEELDWIESRYPGKIINITGIDHYNDFDSVAALMKCMDLMIAPATTVVELAGALGCPTWLLSNSSELYWRKIDERGTDVWHNSITHVEGAVLGDKETLVEQVRKQLFEYIRNTSSVRLKIE
jgi:capsular polysaccharide export protein